MGRALTEDLEGSSDLQQGFATFVEAARRLEQSYAELKQRAEAVDLELADTNRELERTLAERVHLEREVNRLDRLAGLSELALGVAHEIKNPLNGVMGFASLMQRSEDPDQLRGFAGKVVQGLRQVDEIVQAMLAFARPEQARTVTASVEEIVASARAEVGLPASRTRVSGDTDAVAESSAVTRVLANLMRNSIEAGGASTGICIDVRAGDHDIELRVRDDGPGVDAELGERIFEPFVTSKQRGHGLGLALAARILTFLGGSVELVDDGAPGATFLVRVPREVSA